MESFLRLQEIAFEFSRQIQTPCVQNKNKTHEIPDYKHIRESFMKFQIMYKYKIKYC